MRHCVRLRLMNSRWPLSIQLLTNRAESHYRLGKHAYCHINVGESGKVGLFPKL